MTASAGPTARKRTGSARPPSLSGILVSLSVVLYVCTYTDELKRAKTSRYTYNLSYHIEKTDQPICLFYMVRERGLEPPRPKALAPKASVSTNSTTRAKLLVPTHYSKYYS